MYKTFALVSALLRPDYQWLWWNRCFNWKYFRSIRWKIFTYIEGI